MPSKKSSNTKKSKTTKKSADKKSVPKKSVARKPKTVHATEPYHPAFGVILLVVFAIVLAVLIPFTVKMIVKTTESDAMRFSEEYSSVEVENVFKYKTAEEIAEILEHGTGVVYLGFPSCPWCQSYAKMLNSLAKEKGIKEIAYYDIKDIREKNTEFYKKLVKILGAHLQTNDSGQKRIYVPELIFVKNGEIIGNDHETSKDTLGLQDPKEYWTEERVAAWKEKVGALMDKYLEK